MDRTEYLIQLSKNEKICATCKHFYRHYIKEQLGIGNKFVELDEGHCAQPRLKTVKAWRTCEHWEKDERGN